MDKNIFKDFLEMTQASKELKKEKERRDEEAFKRNKEVSLILWLIVTMTHSVMSHHWWFINITYFKAKISGRQAARPTNGRFSQKNFAKQSSI